MRYSQIARLQSRLVLLVVNPHLLGSTCIVLKQCLHPIFLRTFIEISLILRWYLLDAMATSVFTSTSGWYGSSLLCASSGRASEN